MRSEANIIQAEEISQYHHDVGHARGWTIEQSARYWIGTYAAHWRACYNATGIAPKREEYMRMHFDELS